MALLQSATELCIQLERAKDPVESVQIAFKLVKMVPSLVQYAEQLEQSVASNTRHVVCKCEWCGTEFKVYQSELRAGKKSGRYCSRKCWEEQRADIRESREKPEDADDLADTEDPKAPGSEP